MLCDVHVAASLALKWWW